MDALSVLDAAFLDAEDADKNVSMAICSVAMFDGTPPSHDELTRAVSARLPLIPRYHQQVRRFPFDLAPPVWVDDPDFDIDFHIKRAALPVPGGDRELDQLVARVMSQRLERDRPLWQMWVIEGVGGDAWALLSKVHHCMVDGVAGTELYHLLLSPTPEIEPLDVPDIGLPPPTPPSRYRLDADALWRASSTPLKLVRQVADTVQHPAALLDRAVTTGQGLVAMGHVLAPTARSSLMGRIGHERGYASTTVSLSDIKLVGRAFEATVNDVALAAVTAGFRALLIGRGEQPTAHMIRALVPINVRVPGTEGELANRVSCMFADLPVHVEDPAERLAAVRDLLRDAKAHHEAEAGQTLVEFAGYEPFAVVSAMLRLAFRMPQHNIATVTTNVPGPRLPLYLLGRRLTRLLPFVPIADRVRIGIAMLSYCDELTFGITSDYDSADDLDVLTKAIDADIASLRGG